MKYKLVFLKTRQWENYRDDNEMLKDLPNPRVVEYYQDGSVDIECTQYFDTEYRADQYIKKAMNDCVFNLFKGEQLIMTETLKKVV